MDAASFRIDPFYAGRPISDRIDAPSFAVDWLVDAAYTGA